MIVTANQLTKEIYRPGEVAKMLGCTTRTIQNYCKNNQLVSYRSNTDRRLIDKSALIDFLRNTNQFVDDTQDNKHDVIYARVSTHKQQNRGDLDRQVDKIIQFAITKNPRDIQIIKEVGSGLNDNRKQLLNLLNQVCEDKINRIFILYKDRLTRFGFNYIKTICDKHNTQIIIVSNDIEEKTMQEELAEDIIAIIHSFSGKLYGLRKTIKQNIQD